MGVAGTTPVGTNVRLGCHEYLIWVEYLQTGEKPTICHQANVTESRTLDKPAISNESLDCTQAAMG